MRVNLQPAYILHSRAYRDTSQILEVLTPEHGRLSLVAKGARRAVRGGTSGAILQPFTPLLLSFTGRSEMKTLTASEVAGVPQVLRRERLFTGFYLNELVVRLLHRHDPHPELFASYTETLGGLAVAASPDSLLRRFEYSLLDALGYGFSFGVEGSSGEPVRADSWYCYHSDYGLALQPAMAVTEQPTFAGADLLLLANGEFGDPVRLTAKRLLRQALAGLLGGKPLRSRELFRQELKSRSQPASKARVALSESER